MAAKLDDIDIYILRELLKDGRKSFVDLAEECSLTKSAIAKRYEELEKAGIIVGSTIQYNHQRFGYNVVVLIPMVVETQHIDTVRQHIGTLKEIVSYNFYTSKYNLFTLGKLKTIEELDRVKDLINKKIPVQEYKIYFWTNDCRNTPENILPALKNQPEPQITRKEIIDQACETELDELDLKIVEELTKDGRMPFSKIAQKLGTSTGSVVRRYEKLKRNNCIKVTIQINPASFGFQAILHIYIGVSEQKQIGTVVDKISEINGISYVIKMTGDYDLETAALVKDCNDIIRVIGEIEKIPNIKRIESNMIKLPFPYWPNRCQHITTF